MGLRTATKNFPRKGYNESLYRESKNACPNSCCGEYKSKGRRTRDLNHAGPKPQWEAVDKAIENMPSAQSTNSLGAVPIGVNARRMVYNSGVPVKFYDLAISLSTSG